MKKYIQYIFLAFIAGLMSVSCIQELEIETPVAENDVVTLVPRVQSFANKYVTKAYDSNESRIRSLHILVFDSDGNFAYTKSIEGSIEGASPITINKSMLNNPLSPDKLKKSTLVMIANMSLSDIKNGEATLAGDKSSLTLAHMENYSFYFGDDRRFIIDSDITSPDFSGFPMIGGISNIDLSSTKTQQKAIEVGLKILYAKVNFRISVADEGENSIIETGGGKFSLSSYSVNNISKVTSVSIPVNEGESICDFLGNVTDVNNKADDDTYTSSTEYGSSATIEKSGNATIGSEPISFTFYIAENRYNPGEFTYPLSSLHESYKQQYKPAVASADGGSPEGGNATYVQLNGSYVDYRGKTWIVDYTVYLGKNSYDNFHVDRNSEYTNILTIKGIRNHNGRGESVWFDHRVNVTTDPSKYVTITRETLIDSHIEVRPLRVDLSNTDYYAAYINLPNVDWIAAERFTRDNCQDGSLYCYNSKGESTGKRKYFTTNLIQDLKTSVGSSFYLLDNECAWIYFDENTTYKPRQADITITFIDSNGDAKGSPETYRIVQQGLQTLGGYTIESYEEYLHSYDSDDKYNLTTSPLDYTQQGLAWGFSKNSVSTNMIVNATQVPGDGLKDQILESYASYDFFHASDGASYSLYTNETGSWSNGSFGTGLIFTDRAAANHNIKVVDMATLPDNAYRYCLSKNKFKEHDDGNVSMIINWYLPDVYEMQSILAANKNLKNNFADINSKASYWSSQPSYDRLLDFTIPGVDLRLSLINEDTENARAITQENIDDVSKDCSEDLPRETLNRIRCVYTSKGIEVKSEDMVDRIPDGIGGNHIFYMKAWETWNSKPGYFSDLPVNDIIPGGQPYTLDNEYDFPRDADDTNQYFGDYVEVDNGEFGFQENPLDPNKQDTEKKGTTQQYTSYIALHRWPGLTTKRVVPKQTPLTNITYYDLEGDKEETMSVDTSWVTKYDGDILTDQTLSQKLLYTSPNISISFGQGFNTQNKPKYSYNRTNRYKIKSATRTWQLPVYATVYKTDWATQDPIYTPSGTVQLTDRQRQQMERAGGWEVINNEGYIYVDAASAQAAGEKYALPEGAVRISVTTERKLGVAIYKYKVLWESEYYDTRYRFKITYKLPGQKVPHYKYSGEGGSWDEVTGEGSDTRTPDSTPPTTDELKLHRGNSFTISTSSPNYVITKVRVYLKGGNYLDSEYGGAKQTYARFVDNVLIPASGGKIESKDLSFTLDNTDPIELQGMTYSGNSNSQEVWQEWTGSATSLTLALADYVIEDVSGLGITLYTRYTYTIPQTDKNNSVIVDRIEVKCIKKSTTSN